MKEFWRKFDLWCFNQEYILRRIKTALFTVAFVLWGFISLNEFFMMERGTYMIEKRENQKRDRELKLQLARIDVLQEIVLQQEKDKLKR